MLHCTNLGFENTSLACLGSSPHFHFRNYSTVSIEIGLTACVWDATAVRVLSDGKSTCRKPAKVDKTVQRFHAVSTISEHVQRRFPVTPKPNVWCLIQRNHLNSLRHAEILIRSLASVSRLHWKLSVVSRDFPLLNILNVQLHRPDDVDSDFKLLIAAFFGRKVDNTAVLSLHYSFLQARFGSTGVRYRQPRYVADQGTFWNIPKSISEFHQPIV